MDNNITKNEICQDANLSNEISSKFTPKRQASDILARSYERIGYEDKAQRVSECGTLLEFRKPLADESEDWKLHYANFCRDRLCPMCSWRRTYKI